MANNESIEVDLIDQLQLADEDAEEVESDDISNQTNRPNTLIKYQLNADGSIESAESSCALDTVTPPISDFSPSLECLADEQEEKKRLVQQVLELQHTLEDLSRRVHNVKGENCKLKSENQVLDQYIENLMNASSVFQFTPSASESNKSKK